ncbi:MAG TPA: hypothetical protein VJG48_03605 [Candidatus Paceibacterota bacterium]
MAEIEYKDGMGTPYLDIAKFESDLKQAKESKNFEQAMLLREEAIKKGDSNLVAACDQVISEIESSSLANAA